MKHCTLPLPANAGWPYGLHHCSLAKLRGLNLRNSTNNLMDCFNNSFFIASIWKDARDLLLGRFKLPPDASGPECPSITGFQLSCIGVD